MKITRNMSSKFYPDFIPIYFYMVSSARIQLPGTSVLTPETFWKSEQTRYSALLFKAYRRFNTPVQSAPFRRAVVGNRIEFAKPIRNDAIRVNIGVFL
jgi:hypothetical protein